MEFQGDQPRGTCLGLRGNSPNLKAREVVLGYALPEAEGAGLWLSQMNLLSHVQTALDDVQLLGELSSPWNGQAAGEIAGVYVPDPDEGFPAISEEGSAL